MFKDNQYPLTNGLLYLLTTKQEDPDAFSEDEKQNYVDMLYRAGLLYKSDGTRQGWRGRKYNNIVKPYAERYPDRIPREGSGLKQKRVGKVIDVVVGDTEELLDQLQLALASIQAGNTSSLLKNKVIAIADNLFKNNKIKKSTYIETIKYVS